MILTIIEANKGYIAGSILPLATVAMSYLDFIAEWLKVGGMAVGLGVGLLTGYKLLLEIAKLKSK